MLRTISVTCTLGLTAGLIAFCFSYFRGPSEPTIETPDVIDLGVHEVGQRIDTSFVVKNRGRQSLILEDFRIGCGCLKLYRETDTGSVDVSKEAVIPGTSLELRVELMVRADQRGAFRHRVGFKTNDPQQPEAAIEFTGQAEIGVYGIPSQLQVSRLQPGQTAEQELRVVDATRVAHKRSLCVKSGSPLLRVLTVTKSDSPSDREGQVPESQVYIVRTCVTAPRATCNFRESLSVLDSNGAQLATIPVAGSVEARFSLHPSEIVLVPRGSNAEDGRARRCICCSADGKLTLSVVQVPTGLDVRISRTPKASTQMIEVKLRDGIPFAGTRSITLSASGETGQPQTLEVPITITDLALK
jgi:hypothetical protein